MENASASKVPELLLPAGSFEAALAAIEGGADALYFGFSDFSARKQAKNLDRLEYRRLLRHAKEKGVLLYAALNTVILERELPKLAEILAFLGRFPPDAAIVQDWGLARMIRERCPGLRIHASTQCAVQSPKAARVAQELGATRVVLPREIGLEGLRRFAAEIPDLEYEVFVHGALCYSYSGLCLASGRLLDRSGNRGECAQVCRSYYDRVDKDRPGERGYFFSCKDLLLVDRVEELARAGATSLKIEGRMKSPEYCYSVARLYRGALDRLSGKDIGVEAMSSRLDEARLTFARNPTEAWLDERGGAKLIDSEYPGHRGMVAGRIAEIRGDSLLVDLEAPLGLRDGVLVFDGNSAAEPLRYSLTFLKDARTGRDLVSARSGSRVAIPLVGKPRLGGELWRISARELDRRGLSREEYPPFQNLIAAMIAIKDRRLAADLRLPAFDGRGCEGESVTIVGGESLVVERGRSPGGFAKALRVFEESGERDFRLVPTVADEAMADIFVPPSLLKKEKNRVYAELETAIEAATAAYAAAWASTGAEIDAGPYPPLVPPAERPPRAAIVFPHAEIPSGMPYATPRILREAQALPQWGGRHWLPLSPLVEDAEAYDSSVRARVEGELAEGKRLAVGLGTLHHLALARELYPLDRRGNDLVFFADAHFYIANRFSLFEFSRLVPAFGYAYHYLEADESNAKDIIGAFHPDESGLSSIGPGFEPPLFLSSGCLIKQDSPGGACPDPCARRRTSTFRDRDRLYRVIVEDCVTMLFLINKAGGRSAPRP